MKTLDIQTLTENLRTIAKDRNVKIVHAVAIGAHNNGLSRPISDVNISFIYANTLESYFGSQRIDDTITTKIENTTFTGYDLRKAIDLIIKSDANIFEVLTGKPRIISLAKAFRGLEDFAKEYFDPFNVYCYHLAKTAQFFTEMEAGRDVNIKYLFHYIKHSLALHNCSCYGLILNDFVSSVRLSQLTEKSKQTIFDLFIHYRNGRTHTGLTNVNKLIDEIERITDQTAFRYASGPKINTQKVDQFHMNLILELNEQNKE